MSKLEQAARQIIVDWDSGIHLYEAITALREALAEQAEHEPAGTAGELFTMSALERLDVRPSTKVYLNTTPVRTKDLTDDEIRFWIGRFPFLLNEKSEKWVIGLARAVIAADREKNK